MSALVRALMARGQSHTHEAGDITMPLRGGSGALLPTRLSRRLVSSATQADAQRPSPGMAGLLERIQAVRSAILLVPDRPTGVAIALRWSLSPEKFRLETDYDPASRESTSRPWHSR